jgi:broad specificity phosphatase PhoE
MMPRKLALYGLAAGLALAVSWTFSATQKARALIEDGARSNPSAVFLVRHAERAEGEDPPLTEAGKSRADALARTLRDARIDAIYTSEARRTIETAKPLADQNGLSIKMTPAAETSALVRAVLSEQAGKRVLIVGHSNTLPAIMRELGVTTAIHIAESAFDNLFVVISNPPGPPSFIHLHYGASP